MLSHIVFVVDRSRPPILCIIYIARSVTLTPRFELESFLSVFSNAAVVRRGFTKSYILLLGSSAGYWCLIVPSRCFLRLCQALHDPEQKTPSTVC